MKRYIGEDIRGVLTSSYTDRVVDVERRYPEAAEWIREYERHPHCFDKLEAEILRRLEAVDEADVLRTMPLYRGRLLGRPPESSFDFGPPPIDRARANRYNAADTPALYLCTSVDGVKQELRDHHPEEELWIQEFKPLARSAIADARRFRDFDLGEAVFYLLESERDVHPALGRRVGQLVAERFEGMVVPGVRGSQQIRYCNVVLFRPDADDRWREMVENSVGPFR